MDYLNRFKWTVSSVVDSVSSALPGNPISREYDVAEQVGSAGPALSWRLHKACKKTTKKEVCVWVFEKRDVERWPKHEREVFLELIKNGVSRLTRIRHPRVLIVEHPLEESRDSLAFCTEPVFASVANVLGKVDNIATLPNHLVDFQLVDIEIRHGLYQICESLAFLHNDAKMMHRNLSVESVVINAAGAWKLAGMDFVVQGSQQPNTEHLTYPMMEWHQDVLPCAQPTLNYAAPEYFVGARCDTAADMFAFGVLTFAVFNKGAVPYDHGNNMKTFQANANKLKSLPMKLLSSIPAELREDVKMCLNYTPELRPDATQLSKIAYFDNLLLKTLCYFDSLCHMDQAQKVLFFKGLPPVLAQMPRRALLQKVMPVLSAEFSSPELIPCVLPCVFLIAEQAETHEYVQHVLPHLIPVFHMHTPMQICLMLLQQMQLLLSKTPEQETREHVLPLMWHCLECDHPPIQELCLAIIPDVHRLVDSNTMKSTLLPCLLRLATDAHVLSVKVNSLLCLAKMLDKLEKWMVTDQILPALPRINSKEPGVLMAVLGIYKHCYARPNIGMSKELCARSALPFLMQCSIDNGLNLQQFEQFMSVIRSMLNKVELEQKQRLEKLSAMQETQRNVKNFNEVVAESAAKRAVSPDMQGLSGLTTNTNTTANGGTGTKAKGPLTLEDKKRLAAEQESTLRYRAQPALTPNGTRTATAPAPSLRPLPTPPVNGNSKGTHATSNQGTRDLTTLLAMNSNMNTGTKPMYSSTPFNSSTTNTNSTIGSASMNLSQPASSSTQVNWANSGTALTGMDSSFGAFTSPKPAPMASNHGQWQPLKPPPMSQGTQPVTAMLTPMNSHTNTKTSANANAFNDLTAFDSFLSKPVAKPINNQQKRQNTTDRANKTMGSSSVDDLLG